jgi:glyoxylase-like metal-dependent hydrolase (beta-lactamase superfamily II)
LQAKHGQIFVAPASRRRGFSDVCVVERASATRENAMAILKKVLSGRFAVVLFAAGAILAPATAWAQIPQPLLSEDNLKKVSEHVYVIEGFPNVAIVVGMRGTLVVDTGLGERNGATVMRAEQKVAKGPILYLTTTHYHSEHTTGESAFPAGTIIIRNKVQQEEMEKRVAEHMEVFKKMSAQNNDLLQNVKFRAPDVIFDREAKIDLGGVIARIFWIGPAHTKGDELIFVEEDAVLIPGDIVQKNIFPILPNEDASLKGWLAILDQVQVLHPKYVVPDHGPAIVDASQIDAERAYFMALQSRALELKKQGVSVDDASKTMTSELKSKYPDWPNPNNVAGEVHRVYEQSQ